MAVALYARVSTTRQAEQDLSIPDQLQQMRDWCKANGHLIAQEYVEPGASATDDRRPVFQQMMADARLEPAPFELILIHSLSRFFRDLVLFGVYERQLAKRGVRVVSITQQTADDSSGQLARHVFSAFDEYQSQENSKHTSRAMRENARRGFFNGSRAPFGYRAVETEVLGNRGRRKKRLAIDETEAAIVRRIYDHYLNGIEGRSVGMKEIAKHLNASGQTMRGSLWSMQKVCKILSSPTYAGERFYNVIDIKGAKKREPSEWIGIQVEPIIDAETLQRVRHRRERRRRSAVPPRVLSSPVLLTGLLKCGHCGGSMTLATGKSGRYQYYKCTTRMSKGNAHCESRNLPRAKMDELVIEALEGRVFTTGKLLAILAESRRQLQERSASDRHTLARLQNHLRATEGRRDKLLEAIETGVLPLDETLRLRLQRHKAERDGIMVEMAGLRRLATLPALEMLPSRVEAFGNIMRQRLRDRSSGFARSYLHAVVDRVVVTDAKAVITGSHAKLASAISGGKPDSDQVPRLSPDWRAWRDSNSRPSGS